MSGPAPAASLPLGVFGENIQYARDLVAGGLALQSLHNVPSPGSSQSIGKELPADLYRAAWSQAVSAMDHWLHDEIIERAVKLANDTGNRRPPSLAALKMPLRMVDRIESEAMHVVFRDFLEDEFRRRTFHTTEDISAGVKLVTYLSSNDIWDTVGRGLGMTRDHVKNYHDKDIIKRRNDISHRADRDASGQRQPMSEVQASAAVDWVESLVYELFNLLA